MRDRPALRTESITDGATADAATTAEAQPSRTAVTAAPEEARRVVPPAAGSIREAAVPTTDRSTRAMPAAAAAPPLTDPVVDAPPLTDPAVDAPPPAGGEALLGNAGNAPRSDAARFDEAAADPGNLTPSQIELTALLALVDARLAQGQLLAPANDSAILHFERAVDVNPNDPRVLSRRAAIAAGLAGAARLALEQGDLDRTESLTRAAFRLGAERETLALLDLDLDAARRVRALGRHDELLAAARTRLRDGRWVTPDGDGALDYLARLRREEANIPGLAEAWRDLSEKIFASTMTSIEAEDFAAAERWIAVLEIDGADAELAAELELELTQARSLRR